MNNKWTGLKFLTPWFIGIVLFIAFPMIFAAYISLTDWPILGDANFIGFRNYVEIFNDELFWHSLKVTARFALVSVPLGIATAFTMSFLLTTKIKFVSFYRTIYYLPAVVSGVAVAVVWKWILNPNFGIANGILGFIGIDGPNWLGDPDFVLPSYLLIAVWGAGGGILTYLVGLKDVPSDLYEAADIDGAGFFVKLFKITIPLMTPIFYFNLIMGTIASFRKFTDAYIIGGAGREGDFFMVHVFNNAFTFFRMGYATALAWILFAILLSLTLFINFTSKKWMFEG